jgi:AcrR family transcriptional regulator
MRSVARTPRSATVPRRAPSRQTAAAHEPRPKAGKYHHGDLRRALLEEAVRTIRDDGVAALTLRAVGARLGVSRTALYRHFADKSALLNAVSEEGFRRLGDALEGAWDEAGHGVAGFEAQGQAYVRFALDNPAHYRVMFGVWTSRAEDDSALRAAGTRAFELLVNALAELQRQGIVRPDDSAVAIARYVWAAVHGIAMLGIDGRLADGRNGPSRVHEVTSLAVRRLGTGIFLTGPSPL